MTGKPELKLIKGGLDVEPELGGKEPPDGDWLSPLPVNTVFLGRAKRTSDPVLTEFTVMDHSDNAVKLKVTGADPMIWMDPGRFCSQTDLVDILHHGQEN